ncbi:MAG TPA: FMN-binding negative transcriptional regulator [Thiobacillus sp.]|nr:MAG: hypothetical protein B7Y50_06445 [Hydrogenophilales bacterium 28-61-11]OYZ58267.1 MAG: hypothetical protein B7Y21_04110 [Hydrogenophilales bacterium 16-61-112]OZA47644.1 MAG: hypothetical protein B7X81_05005 [Hydrogenophilales bacterium 17-61-76]HQT32272.1 FMN-binding negative transcriptional regulator [Thiobacillus sp.]HQT71756.1 FMN-binding negative transcriptional regulator [Thiobacillus sp.]
MHIEAVSAPSLTRRKSRTTCGEVGASQPRICPASTGPHAYVSPSWYSSAGVPPWNYAVVQLRGIPRLIEGESELEALVEQLTHVHESHLPNPWKPNLTGERRSKLLNMIEGFEIELTDIQGKFKLSQNRSPEDQWSVVEKLSQSSNQTEVAVAKLMSGATS